MLKVFHAAHYQQQRAANVWAVTWVVGRWVVKYLKWVIYKSAKEINLLSVHFIVIFCNTKLEFFL